MQNTTNKFKLIVIKKVTGTSKVKKSLIKKKKSVGMTLEKGKEQDGMMLAKVNEQDGIMLANVKVPSIPTSAA